MNAEQKQRAVDLIDVTKTYRLDAEECAMQMAALLQELVDAPEPEPVARVTGYYAGYLSIATVDGRVLPTGTALYTAPPVPSVPDVANTFKRRAEEIVAMAVNRENYAKINRTIADLVTDIANAAEAPTPAEVLTTTNQAQTSSSQVEAPESEPFGYFKAEPFGWTDCAETDDGAIALYTAPPVSDVEPVAYVTGYNNGYPTIAPINSALCMAIGTALYSAPPAPSVPDGWRLVPYTPTVQMLERAGHAVNNRPQPSKYEPSATPAIIFWTAMLNHAPEAPHPSEPPADVARDAESAGYLYTNVQSGEHHVSDYDDDYRGPERAMWHIEPVYRRAKGRA